MRDYHCSFSYLDCENEVLRYRVKVAEALIRNIGQMVKGSRSELARNIKQAITEYRNEND